MSSQKDYSPEIEEIHHIHKLDAPSGTGITLAEGLLEELGNSKKWTLEESKDPADIHISAIREGEVKGKHTVSYDSNLDSISLSHNAKSREAFAEGALLAAEFISKRKGIFGMKNLLDF